MNFWLELIIKVVLVLGFILVGALVVIYAELKAGSHMQSRIGPYYAGGRWGWAQPLADGLKFLQKEDLAPNGADKRVYNFAPYVVMMSTVAVFVVIPFGPVRPYSRALSAGMTPTPTVRILMSSLPVTS